MNEALELLKANRFTIKRFRYKKGVETWLAISYRYDFVANDAYHPDPLQPENTADVVFCAWCRAIAKKFGLLPKTPPTAAESDEP